MENIKYYNQAKNVLLVTAETYSKYLHPKDRSNRAIFGDAAAATLISIGVKNGKCFYNEQNIVIGKQKEYIIKLSEISKTDLKNNINKF